MSDRKTVRQACIGGRKRRELLFVNDKTMSNVVECSSNNNNSNNLKVQADDDQTNDSFGSNQATLENGRVNDCSAAAAAPPAGTAPSRTKSALPSARKRRKVPTSPVTNTTTSAATLNRNKDNNDQTKSISTKHHVAKKPKRRDASSRVEDSTILEAESSSSSGNASLSSSLPVTALSLLDPLLQFVTRATGHVSVPLPTLKQMIPSNHSCLSDHVLLEQLQCLAECGILHVTLTTNYQQQQPMDGTTAAASAAPPPPLSWDTAAYRIGFPPPNPDAIEESSGSSQDDAAISGSNQKQPMKCTTARAKMLRLHGSTKTAAKRRMAALVRILKEQERERQILTLDTKNAPSEAFEEQPPQPLEEKQPVTQKEEFEEELSPPSPPRRCRTTTTKLWEEPDGPRPMLARKLMKMDKQQEEEEEAGSVHHDYPMDEAEQEARKAVQKLLGWSEETAREKKESHQAAKLKTGGVQQQQPEHPASIMPTKIWNGQLAYAGSHPAQESIYADLAPDTLQQIPQPLLRAFGLTTGATGSSWSERTTATKIRHRRLYRHQVVAIEAALSHKHVCVCTGTGSGKSLCFWIPILTAAYTNNQVSLVLFPTKALAQDQLSKLQELLEQAPETEQDRENLRARIRPAALDGDVPHARRAVIADTCNVILTNPDTLHAAVLPYWKNVHYQFLLSRLRYVVVDEAHLYQGVFGAHVAMILSRLVRVCLVADHSTTKSKRSNESNSDDLISEPAQGSGRITFLATSATLPWPEQHVRLLCPIAHDAPLVVQDGTHDGSPRSAKHFFVWNPPVMRADGTPLDRVDFPRTKASAAAATAATQMNRPNDFRTGTENIPATGSGGKKRARPTDKNRNWSPEHAEDRAGIVSITPESTENHTLQDYTAWMQQQTQQQQLRRHRHGPTPSRESHFFRRHAADETALLLARAVSQGVRCIAFCKTRNLVEWVYERALTALKREDNTAHLACRIESYRGGYSMDERRKIEQRLFRNELLGVIGTNALELGVDIGGIDLTLHCGYPTSHASLLQQAGRAGRAKGRLTVPSCSIVVCFNSPSEQHMWKHPKSLLGQGVMATHSIPINCNLVQSHLLCASEEYPLTGALAVTALTCPKVNESNLSDFALFGGQEIYEDAVEELHRNGSVTKEQIGIPCQNGSSATIFKAHPSMKHSWSRVSIRAIEPVNYSIVDLSHPGQGGLMDGIHDPKAILDTLPYSRVFYHAHPGAIITHRGRKYKIMSMTRPPAFTSDNFGYRRSISLAAFARPTNERYITRPLSTLNIHVVKTFELVGLGTSDTATPPLEGDCVKCATPSIDSKCETRDMLVTASSGLQAATSSNSDNAKTAEGKSPAGSTCIMPTAYIESNDPSIAIDESSKGASDAGSLISKLCQHAQGDSAAADSSDAFGRTLAGCGAVSVKRTVHGYKKLSIINRSELSRTELSLPPMEFDSFGIWFDTDAEVLSSFLGDKYGPGVHALSHAILAVAPVFAPGLVREDLECDHAWYAPTRVVLFDERAGGSGACERIWKLFFQPNSILNAAIDLLQQCSWCTSECGYDGGCPACLHASNCVKFNMFMSRSSAVIIGEHLLDRIKQTDLYKNNAAGNSGKGDKNTTPRRRARERALRQAKEMRRASNKQYVVARPAWPMDGDEVACQQIHGNAN